MPRLSITWMSVSVAVWKHAGRPSLDFAHSPTSTGNGPSARLQDTGLPYLLRWGFYGGCWGSEVGIVPEDLPIAHGKGLGLTNLMISHRM